jgi:hypothetical protein
MEVNQRACSAASRLPVCENAAARPRGNRQGDFALLIGIVNRPVGVRRS